MHKFFLSFLILFLSLSSTAQSAYDSLKLIYTARVISRSQNEAGGVSSYIKAELNSIADPKKRQLASCAMAENLFGYGLVSDKELLSMVEKVISNPLTDEVRSIAEQVKAEVTRTLVGTKIRSINLPATSGDSIRLQDYYSSGKNFIVVDLWATWCGPCIAEMKKFNDLRQQYPNIEFYSISFDDDMSRVERFVNKNKNYTWPIVWSGMGSPLWHYFKARLIPAFVIVDKNGMVVSHVIGKGLEGELKKLHKR